MKFRKPRPVILLAGAHQFEDPDAVKMRIKFLAERAWYFSPRKVLTHIPSIQEIQPNTRYFTDDPTRIGSSWRDFIAWLSAALQKGCEVMIFDQWLFYDTDPCFGRDTGLVKFLADSQGRFESVDIISNRINFGPSFTPRPRKVGPHLRRKILRAFAKAGNVDDTLKELRSRKVRVSRKTVTAVVRPKGGSP